MDASGGREWGVPTSAGAGSPRVSSQMVGHLHEIIQVHTVNCVWNVAGPQRMVAVVTMIAIVVVVGVVIWPTVLCIHLRGVSH